MLLCFRGYFHLPATRHQSNSSCPAASPRPRRKRTEWLSDYVLLCPASTVSIQFSISVQTCELRTSLWPAPGPSSAASARSMRQRRAANGWNVCWYRTGRESRAPERKCGQRRATGSPHRSKSRRRAQCERTPLRSLALRKTTARARSRCCGGPRTWKRRRPHGRGFAGGRLQRDRGTERVSDQHRVGHTGLLHDAMEVLLFKNAVGAELAGRRAMCAAVIGDHVESARHEALDDAGRAAAVVGDAMQIDDRAAAWQLLPRIASRAARRRRLQTSARRSRAAPIATWPSATGRGARPPRSPATGWRRRRPQWQTPA